MPKMDGRINQKTRFVKPNPSEFMYAPPKQTYKFYQICSFKNPETQMYDVRVVVFNELADIVNVGEYRCSSKQCNKIIKGHKTHQFKIYQTFDLDYVAMPDPADLLQMQSSLLAD